MLRMVPKVLCMVPKVQRMVPKVQLHGAAQALRARSMHDAASRKGRIANAILKGAHNNMDKIFQSGILGP